MNQCKMLFAQTFTLLFPSMHQKLTEHGKFCMKNFVWKNQLPTKSPAEVKDESNAPECPVILIPLPPLKEEKNIAVC